MRLWTIQPAKVWERLERTGRYRAYRSYVERDSDTWRWWSHAYLWMAEQMEKRLGPRPAKNVLPVWAWAHWRGDGKKDKPDLRTYRGMKGAHVRIEVEVERALLSDFAAWHMVLNNSYHALDEKEYEEFYAKVKKHPWPKHLDRRRRKSWERIFDLEAGDPKWMGKPGERAIQACLWELRLEDVSEATLFNR